MKGFFRFLFSGRFLINILLIAIVIFLIIQGMLFWLNTYTRHGESVSVPDLSGLTFDQLSVTLSNTDLFYEITDSIYSEEFPRGVVILQNPLPGKQVKEGRTIFLTVNSLLPEMVPMPALTGKSRRIAVPVLEISGLELEALEYKQDESCTDCVVDQLYKGETIAPGTKIRKGEKIVLVLGQQSGEMTAVPYIVGFTYTEASDILIASSLNMGQVITCEGCETAEDTIAAFVVNQSPGRRNRVGFGSAIDVFLSKEPVSAEEPDDAGIDFDNDETP